MDLISGHWGHLNSGAVASGSETSPSSPWISAAGVAYAAVLCRRDPGGVRVTVEGPVSLLAPAGVEKADQGLDGVGLPEETSEVGTVVSGVGRVGEAAATNGTPSPPLSEQGSPL